MNKLTRPQQNALTFITQFGPSKKELLRAKMDMRAVNALIKAGMIYLRESGEYMPKPADAPVDPEPMTDVPSLDDAMSSASQPVAKVTARPKAKKTPSLGICLCGCQTACKRRFVPGHDGRLKGVLLKTFNGSVERPNLYPYTKNYILTSVWASPEIKTMVQSWEVAS